MRNAGTTTRTTHLQGISFPFQQDAVDALKALVQKKITYVQLVSCPVLGLYKTIMDMLSILGT